MCLLIGLCHKIVVDLIRSCSLKPVFWIVDDDIVVSHLIIKRTRGVFETLIDISMVTRTFDAEILCCEIFDNRFDLEQINSSSSDCLDYFNQWCKYLHSKNFI